MFISDAAAAAAAKSLQSCLTLCDPMDSSLPGFSVHRILQARILERVAILFSISDIGMLFSFFVASLSGFGIRVMVAT